MNKKMITAVFPYDFEFLPVYKYRNLLTDIDVKYLVSPRGFGIEDKDAYYFDDSEKYGAYIQSEITDDEFKQIDVVWITESIYKVPWQVSQEFIKKVIDHKKDILYTGILDDIYMENIINMCNAGNVKVITIKDYINKYNMIDYDNLDINYSLKKIDTPIVAVLGIAPMTSKFHLQVNLRNELMKKEYKISQIGTKPLGETMGFHSIPGWFFDKSYSEQEKILMFNMFVKEIEMKEKPELIIVGIPDCIMSLTDKFNFNYGIGAFEIFNAISPDYSILSLYDGLYNDKFYEKMYNLCKYRFNIDIDSFYISRFRPVSNSLDQPKLTFTHAVGTKNISSNYTVFNAKDINTDKIAESIIKKLSIYSEFQVN